MITHLNRLPLPEIALTSIRAGRLGALLGSLRDRPDVGVRAWYMTLDINVPTVLAACTVRFDGHSVFFMSAATRPDPLTAIEKAVMELLQSAGWLSAPHVRTPPTDEPTLELARVWSRKEHIRLGTFPEFVDTLDWLLATPRKTVVVDDLPDITVDGDSRHQLDRVSREVEAAGLDVYAVDFTPPDLEGLPRTDSGTLQVWRALVPSSQPLTFGPVRCLGGERVYGAPVRAGYRESPLDEAELNPFPHCFP